MNLVVVNHARERALGLLTEFNTNKITTSQAKAATSAVRCTKAAMKQYLSATAFRSV